MCTRTVSLVAFLVIHVGFFAQWRFLIRSWNQLRCRYFLLLWPTIIFCTAVNAAVPRRNGMLPSFCHHRHCSRKSLRSHRQQSFGLKTSRIFNTHNDVHHDDNDFDLKTAPDEDHYDNHQKDHTILRRNCHICDNNSERRSFFKQITSYSAKLTTMTLLGGCTSFVVQPSTSFVCAAAATGTATNNIMNENSPQMAKKPWAPTEALLPAMRVRLLLQQVLQLAKDLDACYTSGSHNDKQQELYLEKLDSILKPPQSGQELIPNTSIRLSFDTYTAYLRYDDQYSFVGTKAEKSNYIRNFGMLPNVKQVVQADLDLRDLYRNEVLTNVDEARAELRYLMDKLLPKNNTKNRTNNQDETKIDTSELVQLLENASTACDKWFAMISPEDIEEARLIVMAVER